jgi:CRP-like cAMP-binding protein
MWNTEAFQDRLRPFASERELTRGEHLFRQGDPIATVFEVLAGRLRLVRRTIDDHLVVLHTAREGELFAESTLFAEAYHCDGVAAVPSRVRTYPKREFIAALRATPEAWEQLAERLAHDLQRLRTQLELRNIRSARERVLQYLWLNAGAAERTVALEGDLQDVAADLGLTRESFYRTLAGLESEGGVARTDQAILLKTSWPT